MDNFPNYLEPFKAHMMSIVQGVCYFIYLFLFVFPTTWEMLGYEHSSVQCWWAFFFLPNLGSTTELTDLKILRLPHTHPYHKGSSSGSKAPEHTGLMGVDRFLTGSVLFLVHSWRPDFIPVDLKSCS